MNHNPASAQKLVLVMSGSIEMVTTFSCSSCVFKRSRLKLIIVSSFLEKSLNNFFPVFLEQFNVGEKVFHQIFEQFWPKYSKISVTMPL